MKESFSFIEYLAAKKTVDDRALNQQVFQTLQGHLPETKPLRVLEIAAGLGNMLERLFDWSLFAGDVHYTAVDVSADYLAMAHERLPIWAAEQGFAVDRKGENHFLFTRPGQRFEWISFSGDIFTFLEAGRSEPLLWDVAIAHAFLDLVNLKLFLPQLFARLTTGGLVYFTINFDGQTILLPPVDPETDQLLMAAYHAAMDRPPTETADRFVGTSRASQALLKELPAAGADILAAGGSDWVVFGRDGRYPHQEAHFLHCIVSTINNSLLGRVDDELLRPWIAARHQQIDNGELVYVAHQLDFVARKR